MASIEGSMAAMSMALKSQNLIAELVTEAANVMDPNGGVSTGSPTPDVQAEVSAAITGLGRIIDRVI